MTKKNGGQTKIQLKKWEKPKADPLRLGFEVTAYAGIDPEPTRI
jgi:coenzyme PQQ precursor peptide PqqA